MIKRMSLNPCFTFSSSGIEVTSFNKYKFLHINTLYIFVSQDAATTTSGVLKSVLAEVNKGTDEPVQESFEEKLKFLAKRHKKEQDHLMARLMLEKKLHEINSKSQ